jgi:hypothetical protein
LQFGLAQVRSSCLADMAMATMHTRTARRTNMRRGLDSAGRAVRRTSHKNVSIGWNAIANGNRPSLSLQFNVENLSNKVYLISKESTMVQGQYSIPRLFSGSLKIGF